MDKYLEKRNEIMRFFSSENKIEKSKPIHSPSNNFNLTIISYKTGENTWNYTRGIVTSNKTGKIIADVKRNYSHFWFTWCKHNNSEEYLLCGEDYQGQTVINLSKEKIENYFPESGFDGHGFCWINTYISPDKNVIAVEGCYWAGPYDVIFLDFSIPDILPYKELKRIEDIGKIMGWDNNGNFVFEKDIEIRKSDGVPYDSLSENEQEILDNNQSLVEYRTDIIKINIVELKSNA